ncbi:MAG: carboxypeptidase M32 [Clostridia bacterium]|nr:carboxypeptidase M32 [Clostridia bacterium]
MNSIEDSIRLFKEQLEKIRAYGHAMGIMYYDMETVMPPAAAELVGDTLGLLSEAEYRLQTDESFLSAMNEILLHPDEVDEITLCEAKRTNEERERIACIPVDEYVQAQIDQTAAFNAWQKAKLNNDFASFLPHLEKLIETTKRFALYYKPDAPVYDTLLDQYEKGLTTETADRFFLQVRSALVPLIEAIQKNGYQPDTSFLDQPYPLDKQRELTRYLMQVMRMDPERTACGEVEHPFTTDFTKNDVRITTHYYENAMQSSMYSVIHEAGHATYELNIADEIARSPLGTGVSMGVHESQSRFYENIIGRSEPFIESIFPKLKELFPAQLEGVTPHMFYLAVNKAEPSLIRTEADELTYALHVMVRYELEKKLFDGSLKACDLPEAWNKLYREYLGVEVPDDTHGVLQDSHWSGGSFGYFPSYAIGSAYGAQLLAKMEQELDIWAFVKEGNLQPIMDWLTERIYRYGCRLDPKDLMEQAFGAPFDPSYYTKYLTAKFSGLYHLS